MRVLVVADPSIPVPPTLYGGIERIVDAMLRGLRKRGTEVALLAHPASTAKADADFRYAHEQPSLLSQVRSVSRARRGFRPDVIHGFARALALGPSLLGDVPKLMSYQRPPTPRSIRLAAAVAGESLHFTGCSEYIARLGRASAGSWSAIPNFVEPERMPYVQSVPDDAPLVFLSRIEQIKGTREAIAIARAAGRRLVIAGNVPADRDSQAYFEQEIRPHVDGRNIQYVGPVDDVAKMRLLGSAAALLVPIQWDEPFGIVFIEALACGTPVISCPRGAVPEIVVHGQHGFHVSDTREGAAAVARLAEISREACRQRVEQRYSAEVVIDQYLRMYRQLLA